MSSAPRFTLDQLLVLEAIAATGSFAGAARELHRVPSAISHTVQVLESGLDLALFDRSGHRAELTAAGRALLDEARELLGRARQLDRVATLLAEGWEPELRVVVDGAWPMAPLVRALQVFGARGVPTQVRIDVEYQDGVVERFDQEHAALMVALGLEDGGRLRGRPLPPLEMVLVAASGHPLAGRAHLDRDALEAHVDLVVKDSSTAYARTPRRSFLGTHHVIRFSDFHAKLLALRAGVGFGWIPRHLAQEDLEAGRLVLLDLPEGNRWSYQPQLITRRDEVPGRAAALFAELLLEDGQND